MAELFCMIYQRCPVNVASNDAEKAIMRDVLYVREILSMTHLLRHAVNTSYVRSNAVLMRHTVQKKRVIHVS